MKIPVRQSTAFTLVELLVILAVLALLAALLLPALARPSAQLKVRRLRRDFSAMGNG